MNKLIAPTIMTAAAALLAACGNSGNSGYAAGDTTTEPSYTAQNDGIQNDRDGDRPCGCPYAKKAAARSDYDNGYPQSSRTYRSTSSDMYTSDRASSVGDDVYSNEGMTGDPNRDYSSDSGCSIKAKEGSWGSGRLEDTFRFDNSGSNDAARGSDNYRSDSESMDSTAARRDKHCSDKSRGESSRGESSDDSYSSSPDNTPSSSSSTTQSAVTDNGYTNMPGRYVNASPGGFSNSSAWSSNGARVEAAPSGGWSSTTSTTVTASSGTGNQPGVVAPTTRNTDAIAVSGDTSADARILSILNVADKEEVEIGRLAQTNGSSREVKEYGDRLVKDHIDHGVRVRSVAAAAGISLMDPDQVKGVLARDVGKKPSEIKDCVAELSDLKGTEFDQKFAAEMKEGHTKMISMVEKAQYDVKNPSVKDLLAKTLPTLREHEQMAAKLNASENSDHYASPDNR